jgi:hypothetical protein
MEHAARTCTCRACRDDWDILTGIQKHELENWVASHPITDDDGPSADLAADLTEDGEVKFRPATLADQLDQVVVKWVWENQHKWMGEVE